jgi:hypothetical protein
VRSLVVGMVGVVDMWVWGVVCLVCVFVGRVWGAVVWRARRVGEVGCWVRERVRWGFWERRAKKLYYLVAPFEICGFQRGVNFVSKFILKERSA